MKLDMTSGSTGEPLVFYWDKAFSALHSATGFLFNSWAYYELGDKILYISNPRPYTSLINNLLNKMWNSITRVHHLSIIDMNNKKSYGIETLARIEPQILYGYVSGLIMLGKMVKEYNIKIRPKIKSIITTSETLDPFYKKKLEEVFEVEIFNRYGSRELGNIMQDCERHEGLHINTEIAFVELIKENGEPANPGERGRIIVTNLTNYVMPFIRYDTGDVGIAGDECSCGRGFPLLKKVEGRSSEAIFTASGKPIPLPGHFLVLGNFIPYITMFQFIQPKLGKVILKIVPSELYSKEVKIKLIKYFEDLFESEVDVEEVNDIPPESSGKRAIVKSYVKPKL
jgi:phenylacetate-CoA ligase